jgi:ABC-type Na+ efflux pump permease subunit
VGEDHTGGPRANHERLTVAQAAVSLGITEGAVRSRIKRGTLPTAKEGTAVFVLLGSASPGTSQANQTTNSGEPNDQSELIASLQDQVSYLREQLDAEREARTEERRRHDTVMAQLTSKLPAIEAPQEASEAPETAETVEEESEGAEPRSVAPGAQEGVSRPWWRRVFGG